ncbi:MAG: GGDEF domain-containing protein [Nocardioidaceae bacterium]
MRRWRSTAFAGTPFPLRVHICGCVLAATVLPFVLVGWGQQEVAHNERLTGLVLLVLSALNVEIGRLLEGGVMHSHRPHKALSAWAFATALLLPTWWLVPVVVLIYAHARWRGLRLPLWKWVGSAAYVSLAALGAALTAHAIRGPGPDLMFPDDGRGLLAIVTGAAVFLAIEALLFLGSAFFNLAADEVWLRRTLAGPTFYLTETAVLLIGGLSAAIWASAPWFLLLLPPVYGLAQQAALHEPLRELANVDSKTGVLRFESWRRVAVIEAERCTSRKQPWSVIFADLDHFKRYNDRWGHLAGDAALAAVAGALRDQLRSRDLVGRFGGEEFCVLLPNTPRLEAEGIAQRLRESVHGLAAPETRAAVTISIGVAIVDPSQDEVEFAEVLTNADRALFEAKDAGRDLVRVKEMPAPVAPVSPEA